LYTVVTAPPEKLQWKPCVLTLIEDPTAAGTSATPTETTTAMTNLRCPTMPLL
jgi:hypothetical protein